MRLIDADEVLKRVKPYEVSDETWSVSGGTAIRLIHNAIDNAPTVDAEPVVHGRWDDSGRYTFPGGATAVRCTECGCALTASEYHLQNWYYCPVCGAKMDGGADCDEG